MVEHKALIKKRFMDAQSRKEALDHRAQLEREERFRRSAASLTRANRSCSESLLERRGRVTQFLDRWEDGCDRARMGLDADDAMRLEVGLSRQAAHTAKLEQFSQGRHSGPSVPELNRHLRNRIRDTLKAKVDTDRDAKNEESTVASDAKLV